MMKPWSILHISRYVCVVTIMLLATGASAQKTDKVLLSNGDWITGEIKKLDYGKLNLKTDAAGTISIRWEDVLTMSSNKYFEINLGRGLTYYGSLDSSSTAYKVYMKDKDEGRQMVDLNLIVEMTPINNIFWARIDGSLDFGFTYTKATEISQLTVGGHISYKAMRNSLDFDINTILTDQPDEVTARRQDLLLNYKYDLRRNFYLAALTSLQQNTELNLAHRLSIGSGLAKNWVRSNSIQFFTLIGLVLNQEKSIGEANTEGNQEGLIHLEFRQFRYSDPEVDVRTYFRLFPSLNVEGRYRWDFNTKLKYEIFKDFFMGLTLYHTLDNQPPDEQSEKVDWGVITSVGYSF
jgi:hypothetical protein